MTVTIDKTAKKYHGAMAANYETKRTKQERWDLENAAVAEMLAKLKPKTVLDVPVGTGRFIPVYDKLKVKDVTAIDVSDTMLDLAKKKMKKVKSKLYVDFVCKDVRKLKYNKSEGKPDVSVCVRFLDLIDEKAMQEVMIKLMELTGKAIITTIRFGPKYKPKSNTAEHDEQKFRAMVKKRGWKIVKSVPVFKAGWHILLIKPK